METPIRFVFDGRGDNLPSGSELNGVWPTGDEDGCQVSIWSFHAQAHALSTSATPIPTGLHAMEIVSKWNGLLWDQGVQW